MQSSKNKNVEKSEPFYRPSVPKQKTSAEIINEARNALRTLRTQRPFTPREDQRKLFGSASSRTPDNRPPSTFSLHASSFESGDSRLVSGTRLSPLDHKPKLLSSSTKDEDSSISFPKPPVNPVEVRKVSSARARLCRTASQGYLLPDKIFLPDENKEQVNSEEPAPMDNLSRRSNRSYLAELNPRSSAKDDGIPLVYNEHNKAEEQDFLKGAVTTSPLQFKSGSDQNKIGDKPSSNLSLTDWNKSGNKAGSEDDSRVNETEEEENYWNVKILPIVYELENEDNIENLCLACTSLHEALEEGNMFGKKFKGRSVLLKTLYKLVDIGSEPLGLKLAKIILALYTKAERLSLNLIENEINVELLAKLKLENTVTIMLKVSGKNLLNVCKLVFKISRNEKNDSLIQTDGLLDSLLEILRIEDLHTNHEAFLYCTGAIKFISGNAVLLNELANKGGVEIMFQLMKRINNIKENDTCFSNLGHLLVQIFETLHCSLNVYPDCDQRSLKILHKFLGQLISNSVAFLVFDFSMMTELTATLRNLIDLPRSRCQLLCCSAVSELWVVLEQRLNDKDICTNIVRIFSKLSSYNDCCAALADYSRCYVLFLALLNKHQKKQDLVVRVVFILGNLTAKNNQAREQFFKEKGSADTLISLFQTYNELDLNAKKEKHEGEQNKTKQKHPSEGDDVLIKLIRVLANLSIHPSVGAALAANHHVVALLITVLEYKSIDDCEELVINATATINNLSYYKVRNSVIEDKKLHIAELLLKLLMSSNMDGILEAVRVFGNLSQYFEICDFIIQRKVYKFMVALLDAKHQDVCFSACGVLLNLTVDKNKRPILKEGGGIKKLVDCLRDFGPTDWQLACLVCKTLWNYSENIASAASCFEDDDINTLLVLLASLLDEELALDYGFDRDLKNYHKLCWETEFKPVAQKLLNRIQNHHSILQPITITGGC